jgi:regulator of protease activity HflC (stomatin/prohibitin superfamily)
MADNPGVFTAICILTIFLFMMMTMLLTAVRIVPEHRRLNIYRLGRYIGQKGPGVVFVLPFIDLAQPIDIGDEVATARDFQQRFGSIGETKTLVYQDGSVEVDGKIWSAVSSHSIPPGTRVRITKVILEIEPLI